MKALSEFPAHILTKGITLKTDLSKEGKTEEEISASFMETFKFKEERLKYFMVAIGVAETNSENLYRIRVINFAEGENIPEKATQIEENYYLPEFIVKSSDKPSVVQKDKARGGGKKDRKKGPKSSPWGASPEEIAAKKEASLKAAAAKKNKQA